MNRSARTLIVLIVALGAAAVSSYAVFRALQEMSRPAVTTTPTVVAAREVPAGTMLTAEDVKVVSWPASSRVPEAFSRVDEAVGRGTIDVLRHNEPLTPGKVAPRGGGAGLPPTIPAGMRAISIRVNEVIGVAGFVVPGARVDVLVTLDGREVSAGNGQNHQSQSTTRMVVSNVVVLTAGSKFDQDKSRKDGKPIPTSVVTLQVTPDDAERIALAGNEGKITLTLRNPLDQIASATPGVSLAHLLGTQTTPPPIVEHKVVRKPRALAVVPPPVAVEAVKPYTIETIRAAKRTEETLK